MESSQHQNPSPMPVTRARTYDEIVKALGQFTDEQRSLAWSPEPPFERLYYPSDCRRGGSCGLGGDLSETRRGRWIQARIRFNKEQAKLAKTAAEVAA